MYILSVCNRSPQSRRILTLVIVRIALTVLNTAFAGVMLERFSARFRPPMMISNEDRMSSRRFDCLDFASMGFEAGVGARRSCSGRAVKKCCRGTVGWVGRQSTLVPTRRTFKSIQRDCSLTRRGRMDPLATVQVLWQPCTYRPSRPSGGPPSPGRGLRVSSRERSSEIDTASDFAKNTLYIRPQAPRRQMAQIFRV